MTRPKKWLIILPVIAALVLTTGGGTARADWDWWDSDGETDDSAGIALAVIVGTVHVVYLGADIGFAARRRWLTPGWAWTQTIWGGLNVLTGVIMTPLGALGQSKSWLGLGIASGVLGTWYMVHGIISLVKYYRRRLRGPPPPDKEKPEDRLGSLRFTLAPTRGGVYTGLQGRF